MRSCFHQTTSSWLLFFFTLLSQCQAFLPRENPQLIGSRYGMIQPQHRLQVHERRPIHITPATRLDFTQDSLKLSQSKQEQYLRMHQKTNRRRAIKRFLNILSVMSGKVLRPLVCSLVKDPVWMNPQKTWDDFWAHKRGKWTNAERVALGLPSLGPTFTKLGQVAATRPDILHIPLADALNRLQDSTSSFDDLTAKRIVRRALQGALRKAQHEIEKTQHSSTGLPYIKNNDDLQTFLNSLSEKPVAAASIAQVYKGYLPGFGPVAVKVQRPGIRKKVERDATLFHSVAEWLEQQKWTRGTPLYGEPLFGTTQFVKTVDEFTARVFEDMDFEREVHNMQVFANLYDPRQGPPSKISRRNPLVVPKVIPELCTDRIIIMEWLEGTKLIDIQDDIQDKQNSEQERLESLALVCKAIESTLSQMFDTGIVHAEPHSANLLKIKGANGDVKLGYLDFGLVNEIPQRFRDGIVCAVVQVVFARNIEAVADLCVEVGLLSEEQMKDPSERKKFLTALERAFDNILIWPKNKSGLHTALPKVRFQNLLTSLAVLIATFKFTVPPYFLNNARALATLEGIALKLDPNFNILRVIYPYSINQLMLNPKVSHKAQESFLDICRNPETKLVDWNRFMMLLNDWSMFTGHRKRRIFWDLATSAGGRRVGYRIVSEFFMKRYRRLRNFVLLQKNVIRNGVADDLRMRPMARIRQHQQAS